MPDRRPRPEIVESLRQDLALERHPADGGGRGWLASGPERVAAATSGTWEIVYEAGEHGIVPGGMLFLQVSPFWGWSTPQVRDPERPGYTEVATGAAGIELEAATLDQQLLGVTIRGRPLGPGERVTIRYGAGPAGALADRFAERRSPFWLAVDGDGDGVRALVDDPPAVAVGPGPAAILHATLPSTARPGEPVRLRLAALDRLGNAGVELAGEVALEDAATGAPLGTARLGDGGLGSVELRFADPGVVRVRARGPGGLETTTNPLQIAESGARVLWADLQNHSAVSDGTAEPDELLAYARDVAALDVVALTDHDHWGIRFLDQTPERWEEIRRVNERFHDPGRFVTLHGYEWTHWVHGHRHVLYFSDGGPLLSAVDPATDTPEALWAALRATGEPVLTLAHHSAGGPISTDWSIAPDLELEPVTEIVSVHGSSEALDSPSLIHRPVPGNFVRDALARGYRLGFLGSSDGHDGHPGLGHLASPTGGLAAILAEEATRDAVYEALRARRVYATSGPRILLRAAFGGHRIGAEIPVGRAGTDVPALYDDTLIARAIAPAPLERIDVVRSGEVVATLDCEAALECSLALVVEGLDAGEYLYLRVVQQDGGAAWTSPFFFVD